MTPSPDDLLDVAYSIGERSRAEWDGVTSHGSRLDPALVRELHVIAKIADAHRAAASDAAPASSEVRTWGHLQIKEELGSGSFGRVYRAWDPRLQCDVALKICRIEPGPAGESVFAEGRLLARVRHANVVIVHGVEARDGDVGLWMDFIDGRTLLEELESRGPLDSREATLIGQDVCRALAAIHNAGILHRDIKPRNVLRERGGRIVLADFGIGCNADAGDAVAGGGTPLFMAPELFTKGQPSIASDIYAVGVLLFYLVTGTHPVSGASRHALEQSHATGRRRLLRDTRPDLPSSFIAVVERACDKDPSRRYETAGAMEQALGRVLDQQQVAPAASAGGRRRRLWPTLGATAAAVAAVALVITAYASIRSGVISGPSSVAAPAAPPSAASSSPPIDPAAFTIQASFNRVENSAATIRLAEDDRVAPGDRLFLELNASRPVHVYVVNEDDTGAAYLLFPLPGQSVRNPLPGGSTHRLPGRRSGEEMYWQVTSPGGQEHFLLVASAEPVALLERIFVALPPAQAGRPVTTAAPVPGEVVRRLRGVGGIASVPRPSLDPGLRSGLPTLRAEAERVTGTWLRQFSLRNPVR